MNIYRTIPMLMLLGGLAGCGNNTVTGEWSCPSNQPAGCYSVEDGDNIALLAIDNRHNGPPVWLVGGLPEDNDLAGNAAPVSDPTPASNPALAGDPAPASDPTPAGDPAPASDPAPAGDPTLVTDLTPALSMSVRSAIQQQRIPEELAEVWIGPFVDDADNYHPPGVIFIQVRPPRWKKP